MPVFILLYYSSCVYIRERVLVLLKLNQCLAKLKPYKMPLNYKAELLVTCD